jgi:HAMP domain-containing protein
VPLAGGGAVQFARSLQSTDSVLARLRWVLLALVLGGVALAAALGRLAARHLVAPVARVTEAARHIAQTEDLGRRIEVTSQDEVGELAARFNAMLDTLEGSIAAQRRLVADASHELRTPVTSLRTNIEVLAETELEPAERAQVIADVQAQAEELGALVGDLIELARGDEVAPVREDVRLDALVAEAIERARRHAPGVEFVASLSPAVVEGVPDRLARAVNNLLDNAARHGDRVEVVGGPEDLAGIAIGSTGRAGVGTGGMVTKVEAARIATGAGIPVVLTAAPLAAAALAGDEIGTLFAPAQVKASARLHWLAHATSARGRLHLDAGAVTAVTERHASLLPAGVTGVDGAFIAGDPVDLIGPTGSVIARGLVNYDALELPTLLGRSTSELAASLGPGYEREIVHRDDLVLLTQR